jgi:hypothetical protein
MTILLWNLLLYAGVGCLEWYLALRRTLACARGERALMVAIVFVENILGLWVLANFIQSSDWMIAVVYSLGASLGALLVAGKDSHDEKARKDADSKKADGEMEALHAASARMEAVSAK